MNQKQKTTLLVAGIVSGLLSLPMTWLTIPNAQLQFNGGFGEAFNSAFPGIPFNITGLNGNLTLLVNTPLWFVIGITIAANVVQLLQSLGIFSISKIVLRITAILAATWITIPMIIAVTSGKVVPGIGLVLGMLSAAAALICLFIPDKR